MQRQCGTAKDLPTISCRNREVSMALKDAHFTRCTAAAAASLTAIIPQLLGGVKAMPRLFGRVARKNTFEGRVVAICILPQIEAFKSRPQQTLPRATVEIEGSQLKNANCQKLAFLRVFRLVHAGFYQRLYCSLASLHRTLDSIGGPAAM
mmetsp:Transcript_107575/g.213688  ORF Transcript_107575/g.213688 Transcript_107575/m.213688 type:complete len:150 (-) Transcript_107575:1277-1726(-)